VRSTRVRPESGDAPPRFVIDFPGTAPHLADLSTAGSAKAQVSEGQIQNLIVQTNEASGGWQAFFDLVGAGDKRAELRLHLQSGNEMESETWVYDYQKSN
jgi:glucan biosynthesis protein